MYENCANMNIGQLGSKGKACTPESRTKCDGGKIIRDLTALHSKVGAVSVSSRSVNNMREYHSNRMDPYPTSRSIWPETSALHMIFTSVCVIVIAGCMVQFSYYLGMLVASIRVTKYNQQQKNSRASR